ncbi:fatty acid desaturase family protein [Alcaligenes aquatilis]|uniref:fatty acid desaturase family protein n=1 Tax=Alcaligenes aquatilis TaxID=323284 RepID=UPI0036227F15
MTNNNPLKVETTVTRLRLPEKFHHISPFSTVLLLTHALAFFLIPAVLAFALVDTPMTTPLSIALAIVLGVIGGHGMHLLTFIGHEGIHTNLYRNKYVSIILAVMFTSVVPFFLIVGFGMTHWKHHRFTNQDIDPDAQIYSRYKGFFSRIFLARSRGVRTYTKNAVRMALGLPWPENTKLPFTLKEMCWISRFNIALNLGFVAIYVLIWQRSVWLGFTVMLIPYITLYLFSTLRAYIEHTGTGKERYRNSRSITSPIYTALFFGSNFHLEHHQYPAVPCYRLPELHRYLVKQGVLNGAGVHVESSFFGALRYTTARFLYPSYELQSTADDFIEEIADGRLDRDAVLPVVNQQTTDTVSTRGIT